MKMSEILVAARKLIEKPENWTQHTFARDKHGQVRPYIREDAHSFCAVGAVRVAGRRAGSDYNPAEQLLDVVTRRMDSCCVDASGFNDTRSHGEVLMLFDKAIEEAKRREEV